MVKIVCKIINLSLLNLACFARSTLLRVVSLSNHALARVYSLFENFRFVMSINKSLHLRATTLVCKQVLSPHDTLALVFNGVVEILIFAF